MNNGAATVAKSSSVDKKAEPKLPKLAWVKKESIVPPPEFVRDSAIAVGKTKKLAEATRANKNKESIAKSLEETAQKQKGESDAVVDALTYKEEDKKNDKASVVPGDKEAHELESSYEVAKKIFLKHCEHHKKSIDPMLPTSFFGAPIEVPSQLSWFFKDTWSKRLLNWIAKDAKEHADFLGGLAAYGLDYSHIYPKWSVFATVFVVLHRLNHLNGKLRLIPSFIPEILRGLVVFFLAMKILMKLFPIRYYRLLLYKVHNHIRRRNVDLSEPQKERFRMLTSPNVASTESREDSNYRPVRPCDSLTITPIVSTPEVYDARPEYLRVCDLKYAVDVMKADYKLYKPLEFFPKKSIFGIEVAVPNAYPHIPKTKNDDGLYTLDEHLLRLQEESFKLDPKFFKFYAHDKCTNYISGELFRQSSLSIQCSDNPQAVREKLNRLIPRMPFVNVDSQKLLLDKMNIVDNTVESLMFAMSDRIVHNPAGRVASIRTENYMTSNGHLKVLV
uniref:Uncharacterized protein n=1 Tax=Hubei tombus-like virus 35 TaxID=1923283 RepID=A0A1L3KGT4_9VIRU|nr:hypothetical protein 1 [Hubei tombus-like virus 35]